MTSTSIRLAALLLLTWRTDLILESACAAVAGPPTFTWRNPTPKGGALEAVVFANNTFVAGGVGGRVLTSGDGATWHLAATIADFDIQGIAFGGNLWVVVGARGRILTSTDLVNWTPRFSTTTQGLNAVTYASDRFLACGFSGTIVTSADGMTWTAIASGASQVLRSIAGRAGAYVAVGDANTLLSSPDGIAWTAVTLTQPSTTLNTVAYLANQFVVIGVQGRIYTSPDGTTWTSRGNNTATGNSYIGVTFDGTQYIIGNLNGALTYTTNFTQRIAVSPAFNPGIVRPALAHGAGVTVAVGAGGDIATTADARTWTQRGANGVINGFRGAAFLNNRWFAVGTAWALFSSADGTQWTRQTIQGLPTQATPAFNAIGFGANRYVAVGELGFIATSTDGVTWAGDATASGTARFLNGVAHNGSRFVTVGDGGTIITSADGLAWSAATSGVTSNLNAVGVLAGGFIAVGNAGVVLTSSNGVAWTRANSGSTQNLNALCVYNGNAYVAGAGRTILASPNGQTWVARGLPAPPPNQTPNFFAIVPVNGGLVVAGNGGTAAFSPNGNDWSFLPVLGASELVAGAASDGTRAIVVGPGGTILQSVDPAAPPSRLVNVATRGLVQPGGALTPGFVLRGGGSKQVVVRAVGPTLSLFGLSAITDVKLEVVNQQTAAVVATNDDWGGSAALSNRFASLGAFALDAASRDAAVQATLPVNSGGYSVRITAGGTATSGVALAEVYDADDATSPVRLANVSTLGFVGTNENALTPGFVISGTAPKRLLVRAIGPGLVPLGVDGVLADPQFSVFPAGASVAIATSNDWGGTPALRATFTAAGAFAIPDSSRDAAVDVTLPPGGYTVVTSGVGNTTGTALVEVYDLDP